MRRFAFLFFTLLVVGCALAGGVAYFTRQNRLSALDREAREAEAKLDAGGADAALPVLKRVAEDGGSPRAMFLLARTAHARGDRAGTDLWLGKLKAVAPPKGEWAAAAAFYEARRALDDKPDGTAALPLLVEVLATYERAEAADHALTTLGRLMLAKGDEPAARRYLEKAIRRAQDRTRAAGQGAGPPVDPAAGPAGALMPPGADSPASQAEFLLGDLNMKALRSPEPQAGDQTYVIKAGDNITKIARTTGVPAELILGINNLKAQKLTIGRQIKAPKLDLSIVVDKGDRTLTLRNNNQFLKKYRVAIARDEKRVPAGSYQITSKSDKPEYVEPETGAIFKAGQPDNPLGSRQMGLRREVCIHGTNRPAEIGGAAAAGWIALKNEDVEEVYALVLAGKTRVTVRGRNPTAEGAPNGGQTK